MLFCLTSLEVLGPERLGKEVTGRMSFARYCGSERQQLRSQKMWGKVIPTDPRKCTGSALQLHSIANFSSGLSGLTQVE